MKGLSTKSLRKITSQIKSSTNNGPRRAKINLQGNPSSHHPDLRRSDLFGPSSPPDLDSSAPYHLLLVPPRYSHFLHPLQLAKLKVIGDQEDR